MKHFSFFVVSLIFVGFGTWASAPLFGSNRPNIVFISIDTLRSDHLSGYGYHRNTSPNLDTLMAGGMRFDQARTVEPLTAPACATMLTARYPHQHGASRNGLPIIPNLPSLPKRLKEEGYTTAAFVSNWTLRTRLVGLAEHFDHYGEIFTRRRWFGLMLSEATAEDITDAGIKWASAAQQPYFLWLHYSEPHAPYRYQADFAAQVDIGKREQTNRIDRYDSEIAFCDAEIGRFLRHLKNAGSGPTPLIVFVADHGESLGEHGYWGHGRNLHEPNLRIPLAFSWPGHIRSGSQTAAASIIDIPKTILSLLDLPSPEGFQGADWSAVLRDPDAVVPDRVTFVQAHRGAVQSQKAVERSRRRGLLEVGLIHQGTKETFRVRPKRYHRYDLTRDPGEQIDLGTANTSEMSQWLREWALAVEQGLVMAGEQEANLASEDWEKLRSLGYVD